MELLWSGGYGWVASSRDLFTKAILCSKQGMTVKITWTVNGVTVASDSSRDLFTKAILCSKQGMTVKITWTVNGVTGVSDSCRDLFTKAILCSKQGMTVKITWTVTPLTVSSQVGSETDQSFGQIITVKNGGFVRQKKLVTDCSVHLHT